MTIKVEKCFFNFHEIIFCFLIYGENRRRIKRIIIKEYKNYLIKEIKDLKKIEKKIIIEFRPNFISSYFKKNNIAYLSFYKEINNKKIITSSFLTKYQISLLSKILINKFLLEEGFYLIHGSAVCINNKAIIFTGKSGAGKSTIVSILRKKYQPLSDDFIFIKKEKKKIYLFQSPYREKNNYFKTNRLFEIKKIYLLKKSKKNKEVKINTQNFNSKNISDILSSITIDPFDKKQVFIFFKKFINLFYIFYFSKNNQKALFDFFENLEI